MTRPEILSLMNRNAGSMGRREQVRWWLRTAEGDLEGARLLLEGGRHNLVAFHAQQAAEKALKAVLAARGHSLRTHAATELLTSLRDLGVSAPDELSNAARRLDLHYIQSRYPNGLGGDPTTYYDEEIARESVELAERFLRYARSRTELDS